MPPSLDTIEDHDLSYYLYLSYLGKFLGIRDAEQLFLVVQMLAWGTVLLLYPAIWYYLTKTWVVGLLTPIATVMILRPMLWTYCNDSYWSMAWTVLMGIPLIAAYEKDCGKNRSFFSGGGNLSRHRIRKRAKRAFLYGDCVGFSCGAYKIIYGKI